MPWAGGYAPGQIPPRSGGNGLAIASLILGGGALLVAWVPFLNYLTIIGALVGLVLGIIAVVRKLGSRGLSLAALIVSGVAFLLTLILVIAYTVSFVDSVNDYSSDDPSSSSSPDDYEPQPGDPVVTPGSPDASAGATVCAAGTPIALGETGILMRDDENQFEVTIESVDLDATQAVMDANSYNSEPPAGYGYGIVSLTVKALSDETIFPGSIRLMYPGVSEDAAGEARTAVLPQPNLVFSPELAAGDSVTGNLPVLIPTGTTNGSIELSSYAADGVCEMSVG